MAKNKKAKKRDKNSRKVAIKRFIRNICEEKCSLCDVVNYLVDLPPDFIFCYDRVYLNNTKKFNCVVLKKLRKIKTWNYNTSMDPTEGEILVFTYLFCDSEICSKEIKVLDDKGMCLSIKNCLEKFRLHVIPDNYAVENMFPVEEEKSRRVKKLKIQKKPKKKEPTLCFFSNMNEEQLRVHLEKLNEDNNS